MRKGFRIAGKIFLGLIVLIGVWLAGSYFYFQYEFDKAIAIAQKPDDAFIMGNPEGDVTIVAFTDSANPISRQIFATMLTAAQEDGHTRVVVRQMPMGKGTLEIGSYIIAAATIDPVKMAVVYKSMVDEGVVTDKKVFLQKAATQGFDLHKLESSLPKDRLLDALMRNGNLLMRCGFRKPPGFLVGMNGYRPNIEPGSEQLGVNGWRMLIDDARERANKEKDAK